MKDPFGTWMRFAATGELPEPAEPEPMVRCEICDSLTPSLGTKRCDTCYELERRILGSPKRARKILDKIEETQLTLAIAALRDIGNQAPTFGDNCLSGDDKMRVAQAALEKMGVPELEAIYSEGGDVVGWK